MLGGSRRDLAGMGEMNTRRKRLAWVSLAGALTLVVVFVARHAIARHAIQTGFTRITGFPLQVGSVRLSPFQSRFEAHQIKVLNPPEFSERLFAEIPRVSVDYTFGSLVRREPHISRLDLVIKRLVIVKNTKGASNIQRLGGAGAPENGHSTKYRIDVFHLELGSVTIKDSSGGKSKERTLVSNLNETFYNITEGTDINRLVLLSVMKNVGLTDFGIQREILKRGLGEVTSASRDFFQDAASVARDGSHRIVNAFRKVVGKDE